MDLRQMTDAELAAALENATAARLAAWEAWRRVPRTELHGEHPAYLRLRDASRVQGDLLAEQADRELAAKLALFRTPALASPEWQRAWIEGPGSDAA